MDAETAARYRWEFMRRSPAYRRAYEQSLQVRELVHKAGGPGDKDAQTACRATLADFGRSKASWPSDACSSFGLLEQDSVSTGSFGLALCFLPDPELDFDALIEYLKKDPAQKDLGADVYRALFGFNVEACCVFNEPEKEHPPFGEVLFRVDLTKVNSIQDVIAGFKKSIRHYHKLYKRASGVPSIRDRDFETILRIGDQKAQNKGLTFQDIAKAESPSRFDPTRDECNPEAEIERIRRICKEYKKLVSGGYRFITAP